MGVRTWARKVVAGFKQKPRAAFDAAKRDRLTFNFLTPSTSADAELNGSLAKLRDSARRLARDNPHARAIKRTYRVNIFGHRGIALQAQVKKIGTDELDELRNNLTEREYKRWCRARTCDVAGKKTLHGFELDIASALCESGELFFIIRRRPFGGSRVPIALEAVEADQVDEDETGVSDIPGRRWVMGIELDEWNRPTRYKFLTRHPGDYELSAGRAGRKHVTIPASDVIHVYGIPERVGQTRCEPILTPVILTAWNLQEYKTAHWTKKRAQASQMGWITNPEGDLLGDETEEGTGRRIINVEAGRINELDPGQQFTPPDFGPPDSEYDTVLKTQIRDEATGTGCSYATISKDYSDANYSSLRISTAEDRDWWRMLQTAVIEQFHQRVYEEWLYAAVMAGVLPSPTFDDYWFRPERYNEPRWQARAWSALDPAKELKALREERELQLKTHSQQLAETSGEDFIDTVNRIAYEKDYKRERGALNPVDEPMVEVNPPAPTPEPE
jgi:lambda family phage portal protein